MSTIAATRFIGIPQPQSAHPAGVRHFAHTHFSPTRLALVVAAHLAVLALLAAAPAAPISMPMSALMVELLTPENPASLPAPQVPQPAPTPLKPVEKRIVPKRAVTPTLPAQETTDPAPLLPAASQDISAPAQPSTVASNVQATSPAVSQPRFDADYLSNPAPAYPPLSRRLGEEGKTILRVFVEPAGHPGQIEIRSSSGSPRLDRAAEEAVRRWKFIPARRGNEAVGAWVLVPIVFNLKG